MSRDGDMFDVRVEEDLPMDQVRMRVRADRIWSIPARAFADVTGSFERMAQEIGRSLTKSILAVGPAMGRRGGSSDHYTPGTRTAASMTCIQCGSRSVWKTVHGLTCNSCGHSWRSGEKVAQFDSQCPRCKEMIREGDPIEPQQAQFEDPYFRPRYAHVGCRPPAKGPLTRLSTDVEAVRSAGRRG